MLSVTAYISTDLAAVPLLWIIPLSLYLVTFVLAFARRPPLPRRLLSRALPIGVVALTMALAMRTTRPLLVILPLHLIVFFLIAMVCHGELAARRPVVRHLTSFYLWM
jgi:hypothetical protein